MNGDIERGFVAVIRLAMPDHEIREATSSKPLRGDAHLVIVECPESEHIAGPLYRATVRASLTTNPHDLSEAYHGTAAGLLSKAFEDPRQVTSRFNAAAGTLSLQGIHVKSHTEDVVDGTWRATVELVAGIRLG